MKEYQVNDIRNITLVGGSKAGKTTLAECMLFEGGSITRRGNIDDKNTTSDYKQIELERGNSIFSSVLYTEFNQKKLNIIDIPGFDDFVGEMYSALKVTESAALVVNAQNGVEVGTEVAWRNTEKHNKPLMVIVNHLDHENTKFDETIAQMKQYFGNKIILAQYPVNAGLEFDSIVDIIKMKLYKYPKEGGKPEILDIPDSEKEKAGQLQNELIEAAAENDENLMEIFFDKGTLSEDEMRKGISLGILSRGLFPVFCTAAKANKGTQRIMEFITNVMPGPKDIPLPKTIKDKELAYDNAASPLAFIFKTSIEPHLGEVSFFKLYNGVLTEGIDLVNAQTDSKERLSQLFFINGKNREKVSKVTSGDIGATIKLKDTHTNNTLNNGKETDYIVPKIEFPNPKYRTAIKAKNTADQEKLTSILKMLHEIDPTIIMEQSVELKQTLLFGQGELQINIAKWHIENTEKIPVDLVKPKIPYRETITKSAKASYRHKKQSGGAGQFGEVHMMIQPYKEGMKEQTEFPIRNKDEIKLNWGGMLIFNNCIVGGAIDTGFMPAILKGINEKMVEGPLTGSYARDIVVNIYDGKMHPVDSNEVSFKLAGRNAFKDAFKQAGPIILEPIYDVVVVIPEDKMGDVMTDLQGRRAMIMGMDSEGSTYKKITAKVPLKEMDRYSTSLSSITSGRGTYEMKYAEYQKVPNDIQDQLLKEYEEQEQEEE